MAKRIFISFAVEDAHFRDFVVGQARNAHSPFEFMDMSVKEPWLADWKTKCRTKIKGCDGMIALLSSNTPDAAGAKWEVQCAIEEGVPVKGMYVSRTNRPAYIPSEMKGVSAMEWSWDGLQRFVDGL